MQGIWLLGSFFRGSVQTADQHNDRHWSLNRGHGSPFLGGTREATSIRRDYGHCMWHWDVSTISWRSTITSISSGPSFTRMSSTIAEWLFTTARSFSFDLRCGLRMTETIESCAILLLGWNIASGKIIIYQESYKRSPSRCELGSSLLPLDSALVG